MTMEPTMSELMNHTADMGQAAMFSKAWYNDYFRRAADSPAHARFCETVYGRDLCQHGMMDVDEMAFVAGLLRHDERVLEVGCSNGRISEVLQQQSGCRLLGVDYADVAVEQALRRTADRRDRLDFHCADLTRDELPGADFDTVLAIDSIYFMGDYAATLRKLNAKLKPGGRMIIAAFQVREADDPADVLEPAHTRMSQALRGLGCDFIQHDFTANVRNHWVKNHQQARALQADFEAEGNGFLCTARMAENGWFRDHAEAGTLVRYLYVIEQNPRLVGG
jgi:SAM-dependent methyltransferase